MGTWAIQWHDEDGKGYRDIIHRHLITSNGTITHDIVGPRGGISTGKAKVTREGTFVDLDYGLFEENVSNSLALGVMRLQFDDDKFDGTPTVLWRDQGETTFAPMVATALPVSQQFVSIIDDVGNPVHARFLVEVDAHGLEITMDSRGGTVGQHTERNRGYSAGLKLMLRRLASASVIVADALLTSGPSLKESPNPEGRRLSPKGFVMPVPLAEVDTDRLASALQREQGTTLTTSKTGSGNMTRRFTLKLKTTLKRSDVETLVAKGFDGVSSTDVEEVEDDFDPASVETAKDRVVRSIAARRGQRKFRHALLKAYSGKCAMTGCADTEVLEAAHIAPYIGTSTNHVQNGLLLRADLHTLFDLDLIGVDVTTWTITVSKRLRDPAYRKLHGAKLSLPSSTSKMPSYVALQTRFLAFSANDDGAT